MRSYLEGQRFGSLVAIEETEERHNNAVVWRCRCDCGNEVLVESRKLTSGAVTSCGCEKKKYPRNIAGVRFGKLTAVAPTNQRTKGGYVIWRCVCDCGNEVEVSRNNLIQGMTYSCGCAKHTNGGHLDGRKFGHITVIDKNKQNGSYILWNCRCDCGREFTVQGRELLSGRVTHCGCGDNPVNNEIEKEALEHPLQGRIPKGNISGCKGVTYNEKRRRWIARYMHKGKNYYLGSFYSLTDAINARTAKEMEIRQSENDG